VPNPTDVLGPYICMKRNRELQSTRSGLEKGSQPNGRLLYMYEHFSC